MPQWPGLWPGRCRFALMQPTHPLRPGSPFRPWPTKAPILAKGRMPARARVAANPVTTAAKGKIPAKEKAAAPAKEKAKPATGRSPLWRLAQPIDSSRRFSERRFFENTKPATPCPQIPSTISLTTESASDCACRTTGTFSRRNRWSIGSRSSRKTSWSTAAGRSKCSTRSSSNTAWSSTASPCTSAQADRLNREHLKKLKRLVKRTETPWLSDHLCWGSVDGRYTHDLLPMPYTFAAARVTAANIREARDFLEVPICVENVSSYAEFHASEMTEWEFLSEVVERADCGILLDVNNIYVSSQNHNFDPYDYSEQCPASPRRADPHRRAFEVREIHSRHPRSSGARSGLENVRARHETRRSHRHAARMGRQHSQLSTKFTMKRSKPNKFSDTSPPRLT